MGTTDGQVDYTGWMFLGDQQAGNRHRVGTLDAFVSMEH